MRYISWNCKGLGSTLKEEAMKDLVRIHKPEILLVQETKMEETTILQAGKKFWKKGPGIGNNSRGASGGIATFWDSTLYDLEAEAALGFHKAHPQTIWTNCKSVQPLCPCLTLRKKRLLEYVRVLS